MRACQHSGEAFNVAVLSLLTGQHGSHNFDAITQSETVKVRVFLYDMVFEIFYCLIFNLFHYLLFLIWLFVLSQSIVGRLTAKGVATYVTSLIDSLACV